MDSDSIYNSICEGGTSTELQDAWDAYEDENGTIQVGSKVDDLIYALIVYVLKITEDD
jgi:hypothetical protein